MSWVLPRNRLVDPVEQSLVWDIRIRLGDDYPDRYLFDDPVYRWLDDEIRVFYYDALEYVNQAPPITGWLVTGNPMDGMTREGAVILALEQMIIRQAGEKFSFSDYGFVLTFDKYAAYQSALAAMGGKAGWISTIYKYKMGHRPRAIGIGSQSLPFNIMRPLGLIPSLRSVFGI